MYQKLTVIGRLTKDPVQKTFGENTVTNFTLAADDGFGDKKTTEFFDCALWGKRGDAVAQHSKKGDTLQVEGPMKSRQTDDGKKYWTLNVNDFRFIPKGGSPSGNSHQGVEQTHQPTQSQYDPYSQPTQFNSFAQQNPFAQQPQHNPYGQQQNPFSGQPVNINIDDLPF